MKVLILACMLLTVGGREPLRIDSAAPPAGASGLPVTMESEPNDTLATATFLGGIAQGIHGVGALRPGDVDVWSTWLGFPAGPSDWGFVMTVKGSAQLEVSVGQILVTPLGITWRRLAHGRGHGQVHLHPVDFEHWPQSPIPYLFLWVRGDPQAYSITVP